MAKDRPHVTRQIVKYNALLGKMHHLRQELQREEEALINMLRGIELFDCDKAVLHHILHTEKRWLTPEQVEVVYQTNAE